MIKMILVVLLDIIMICADAQVLKDGEYYIKINDTGKFLAITGADKKNGARLIQWDNEYKTHFSFILTHLGNDIYTIKAKHSGKYLSTEGTPAAGVRIIQWDWLNQMNQRWHIVKQKGSRGYVMSSAENKMRVVMQHWNSSVRPGNGTYLFLSGDNTMRGMVMDFKRNEIEAIEENADKQESPEKPAKPTIKPVKSKQ
ncbi:RICIN domain-containing protein [Terrimonas sp. NA20]|uniref:RICIN domain-containing protein n=1 Tax=Terrimonas ginsenosidimutans TaxID=2908004 RepID=A0ABS9KUG2_9BACT|nr:RICIN domain-containing protein [Terrimonas ginsenosidimutans]MCG2615966.1 RICIN domain-containing protein [Terrimonas ginsenosidimutans]